MTYPFLKWPGGKRWLLPIFLETIKGIKFGKYYEPFLGGGAIFFGIEPNEAFLSDINRDLINTYTQVKTRPHRLIEKLKSFEISKATFLRLRDESDGTPIDRATRFLYLNRTSFAGMYRLNKQGKFNVPYGGGERTTEILWRDNLLINASKSLKKAKLRISDFEAMIKKAEERDLVFCDPTYTTMHNHNGFIRYNEKNFSWRDQIRLAKCCKKAAERGAMVIVSNAYHKEILDLYPNSHKLLLNRKSLLCPKPQNRKTTSEVMIVFDYLDNLKTEYLGSTRFERIVEHAPNVQFLSV